jgi:hypothetical protein
MRRSLVAAAVLLLSSSVGNAQEKQPVHVVIQAAPQQIKKAALAMFARNGYSLDLETASQLKISKTFSNEETNAYNTAHWTNPPVANCRRVNTFLLSPEDHLISVSMVSETVCHSDGGWKIFRSEDEKDIQSMQDTLAGLKAKIEGADPRH